LILTEARRGEIAGLRWSEIHQTSIELEGDRTKNGEPHTIPLSAPALVVIESVPRIEGSDLIFSTNQKTPISGWSKTRARLGDGDWTIHDIRRTDNIRLCLIEALVFSSQFFARGEVLSDLVPGIEPSP
jgi:integrase